MLTKPVGMRRSRFQGKPSMSQLSDFSSNFLPVILKQSDMQIQVIAPWMAKWIRKYFMIEVFMCLLQEKEDHEQMLARWEFLPRRKERKSPVVIHAPFQLHVRNGMLKVGNSWSKPPPVAPWGRATLTKVFSTFFLTKVISNPNSDCKGRIPWIS